ncbi:Predicted transcriptional regulator YheO, contains PAS and DNA-binding HTH domains [Clostridium acidisoli DSM 12555]|uniref:Predicted transcriptional regulator YheO, contains PAS and DNA-binding HTH domains n=1 Tax=Clostridium acidisoli DSM 12555 TaxID=1121291 RepID=A0A1W1XRI1_9CLOT|nr:PAS domain-containing protein [Clostridium acidisoli]SMC26590.1 Predicted transcriptional regulator YheO, contains PAS and DNA-binding HTH domains [Clostridium acidisoli DSM 12555]
MRKINPYLEKYKSLVKFLGEVFGKDTEIALHDLTNVDNSIVEISNSKVSGREVGAPATNLALKILKAGEYNHKDYIVNYKGISSNGTTLKSSTYFIKDDKKEIVGMLCINMNLQKFKEFRNFLDDFIGVEAKDTNNENIERFDHSVEELTIDSIDEIIISSGIPPERMSQEEKIEIIKKLNDKGMFLLKGVVSEIAIKLKTSEATIYRYLSKIKKEV